MSTTLFLTGQPHVGKSWAIKKIIDHIGRERCGGFYTEEICDRGARVGFRLVTLDGQSGIFAHNKSESVVRLGRYGVNLDCLEAIGLVALNQARKTKLLIILDEIGPMQALSRPFQETVLDLLDNHHFLLGTIAIHPHPWLDMVKQHESVEIFEMTVGNREYIVDQLIARIYSLLDN